MCGDRAREALSPYSLYIYIYIYIYILLRYASLDDLARHSRCQRPAYAGGRRRDETDEDGTNEDDTSRAPYPSSDLKLTRGGDAARTPRHRAPYATEIHANQASDGPDRAHSRPGPRPTGRVGGQHVATPTCGQDQPETYLIRMQLGDEVREGDDDLTGL